MRIHKELRENYDTAEIHHELKVPKLDTFILEREIRPVAIDDG